jgi:hypothetical protein
MLTSTVVDLTLAAMQEKIPTKHSDTTQPLEITLLPVK